MKVALVGASDKEDRFAYKAFKELTAAGHRVFLIHPKLVSVEGASVYKDLSELPERPESITLYVSAAASTPLAQVIINTGAKRVIFNPGTENPPLEAELKAAGLSVIHDCTLMMLDGGRF